jgi:uncharacterized tellurite resistance protein B-like protein
MLADLLRRLAAPPTSEPLAEDDARLALAALMVRVARTDGRYSTDEQRRIDGQLGQHYRLAPEAAAGLRAEAEVAEAEAQDNVQFTRLIKDAVPYGERTWVIEALWRIAATGGIQADEHGLMRLVASLLGVSDQDSGLARQRVLRSEGR